MKTLVLLLLVSAGWLHAAGPENAAPLYREAFAIMEKQTEAEKKALHQVWRNEPGHNAVVDAVLGKAAPALATVSKAALLPHCDWEHHYADGPGLAMPHLNGIISANTLFCLRARSRLKADKPLEAVADYASCLRMARHAAPKGRAVLLEALVQISVETRTVDDLAAHFSRLDEPALRDLAGQLSGLPARQSLKEALLQERELMMPWLRKAGEKPSADAAGCASLKALVATQKKGADVATTLRELDEDYARLIALYDLPPREAQARIAAFFRELQRTKPERLLSAITLPPIDGVYPRELMALMKLAMLEAAIAIRLEGLQAVARVANPYTGEPFEYRATGHGFELRSPEIPYLEKWDGALEFR